MIWDVLYSIAIYNPVTLLSISEVMSFRNTPMFTHLLLWHHVHLSLQYMVLPPDSEAATKVWRLTPEFQKK